MANEVSATIRLLVQEEVSSRMKQAREEVNKLQKTSDTTKGAVSALFRELAGPAAGLGAGAAIGIFVKNSLEAANALQELNTRAEVVFGERFPQAQAQAAALGATLHRSADDMLNNATRLTMVAEGLGFGSDKAQRMSFDLTRLGVEFSKAFGGSQEGAIDAITMAMEGSTRGLRQYGIVLNDSALQQFAHTKGIKDSTSEMTQAQKALLTYQYLMERTSDIQEAAAKNTGNLRDRTAEFTDAWNDLLQAAGSPILPAASKVFEGLTAIINDARASLGGFVQDFQALGSLLNLKSGGYFSGVADRFHKIFAAGTDNKIDLNDSAFSQPDGKAFDKLSLAAAHASENIKGMYGSLGDPSGASKKAAGEAAKLADAMKTVGNTYQDTARTVEQKLIDLDAKHRDSMESIRDQIDQTKKSIRDLTQEYNRSIDDLDKRDADAIIRNSENVDDLTKKLDELTRKRQSIIQNGWSVSLDLQEDIDKAQAKLDALNAAKDKALKGASAGVLTQYGERKDQTDLERELADSKKRREDLKSDFDQRSTELNEELTKLDAKKTAEEQAYTAQRTQLQLTKAALSSFVVDYSASMANINKVTQDTVDSLNKKLDELKSSISAIDALVQSRADLTGGGTLSEKVNQRAAGRLTDIPKFAHGGTVFRPTLALVGENGPERITPLGKESGSASITISFGDVHIAKEVDADEVIRKITRSIQLYAQAA